MEPSEYPRIYERERSYWWYRGLQQLVLSHIPSTQQPLILLDAGCGTGLRLRSMPPMVQAFGVDHSPFCIDIWKKERLKNIARASVSQLPFPNDHFDWVISTDVLYHRDVKDDLYPQG